MQKWTHHAQSENFLKSIFPSKYFQILNINNNYFARFTFNLPFINFPIILDYVVTSEDLILEKERGLRLIFWDKMKTYKVNGENISNMQKQKGWLQARWIFAQARPPIAVIDLQDKTTENYFKNWGSTLKNYRNKWLKNIQNKEIEIYVSNIEDFDLHYAKSSMKKYLKKFYTKQMYDFKKIYGDDIKFYLIKTKEGKVVAGTCIIDEKETGQAIYQYVFTDKSNQYKYIGVGIIDFCIDYAMKNKFQFLDLTAIWAKGQPSSYKGLTAFKMQFQPEIYSFYNTYIKIQINF